MPDLTNLGGLSLFVKAGWTVWMMWCGIQVLWYRRGRSAQPPDASFALRFPSFGSRRRVVRPVVRHTRLGLSGAGDADPSTIAVLQ
jgi:hypothetical protein